MSDVIASSFVFRAPVIQRAAQSDVFGIAACVIAPLATGILAVVLGQDANWDLRNYHWYNAHAALNGRFGIDLAPAHTPTYFNPLLDIVLYGLAMMAPAKGVSFALGLVQGFNFIPLYFISVLLIPWWATLGRGTVGAAIAGVGLLGGGHFGLIGTTFFDNVVSIPILFGIWLSLRALHHGESRGVMWALIGALIGFGVGLKLPAATYGLGFCVALAVADGSFRARLIRTLNGGLGAFAGMMASAGWWMGHLYVATGNPMFPFFNQVFRSPLALAEGYRDTQFVPGSPLEAIAFPFLLGLNPRIAGEIEFTDYRIAAMAAIGIAVAVVLLTRRRHETVPALSAPIVFATAFLVVSYTAWLGMFAIYRYLITIEMLAPIMIAAMIARSPLSGAVRAVAVATVLAALAATTRPGDWGRVPWSNDFVEVSLPQDVDPGSMVLMAGHTPTAWVASAFPDTVPFVRLHGFSYGPDDGDAGWAGEARRRVAAHRGSMYLVIDHNERDVAEDVLTQYALQPMIDDCRAIGSNLSDDVRLCPVNRSKAPMP